MTHAGTPPGRPRHPLEHRLMAALGVVAVSAMALADGGLFGNVPDTPGGARAAAELPLLRLHLSGADVAHFERLYTHLEEPERNSQRYRAENSWRRAQLAYAGRLYRDSCQEPWPQIHPITPK